MAVIINNKYNIPEFNDELINDIEDDKDIFYNKHYKQDTYKGEALFYINWTCGDRKFIIKAYGYKPDGYKHIDNLGNMYFVSNTYFVLMGREPFNIDQIYKLTNTMYCFDK